MIRQEHMFSIEVQATFCAAHALRLPGGACEPLHGHNFLVTARLACHELDALGTVVDFHRVERWLGAILHPWNSRNLNELEPFVARVNPSAERIAQEIGQALQKALASECATDMNARGLHLAEVRLTEAPGCLAIWNP
jgi:6-pyruvoyltetrahydropterin/6-carboxytetrahydropterin synthase